MTSRTESLAELLAAHKFLTEAETAHKRRKITACIFLCCIAALVAIVAWHFAQANTLKDSLVFLAGGAAFTMLGLVFLIDDYRDVRVEKLQMVTPMLNDDGELRAAVKEWLDQRALHVRDFRYLRSLIPVWQSRRKLAAFQQSLAEPIQHPPEKHADQL